MIALRNLDLVLLALALPVFLVAGCPIGGWVTAAVIWAHVARHRLVVRPQGRGGDGSEARRRHRDRIDDRSRMAHGA